MIILEALLEIHTHHLGILLSFLSTQMLIDFFLRGNYEKERNSNTGSIPPRYTGVRLGLVTKGSTSPRITVGIQTLLSPWCGIGYPYDPFKRHLVDEQEEPGVNDVRPWTYPENWHRDPARLNERPKNSLDPSIVIPRLFDKFPEGFEYNYDPVRR